MQSSCGRSCHGGQRFLGSTSAECQKKIVEDVSFTVRKGEILGIGGLVGAGRSELVNAVFGIIGKQSGAVMIDGREVQIRKPEDAIREGLALVTEDRKLDGFVGGMSIEENITLASLKAICRYGIINHKKSSCLPENILMN